MADDKSPSAKEAEDKDKKIAPAGPKAEQQKKPEAEKKEEPKKETPKQEPANAEKPAPASKPEAEKTEEKKEDAKSKKEDKKVEVPAKFKTLVESIEKLSVLELSELVKVLEDKFGVSAAAPVAVAAAPGGAAPAGGEAAAEEKSEFDIELTEMGSQKIAVIKAVKQITGAGLAEAKKMTEGAPVVIKEKASKEDAETAKKALEEAGAKVTLK